MKSASIAITVLTFTLATGLAVADPWKDESGRRWRVDEEDREEILEDREERLEEFREDLEERRERAAERAEEWRERGGWRGPAYAPPPPPAYVEPQPRYERYRYEGYGDEGYGPERPREFFVPPPPADHPGYGQPQGPSLPPRDDDDEDLDAVYTPFGFYEEYPESSHNGHGSRPRAHGQIGPFRFEVWK